MRNKCAIMCVLVRAPLELCDERVERDNGRNGACAPDKHTLLLAPTVGTSLTKVQNARSLLM